MENTFPKIIDGKRSRRFTGVSGRTQLQSRGSWGRNQFGTETPGGSQFKVL